MLASAGPEQEKSTMKPIMISAIALATAISATPAAAQIYGPNPGSAPPASARDYGPTPASDAPVAAQDYGKTPAPAAKPARDLPKAKQSPAAKSTITPSNAAENAIRELQKAVIANDDVHIPAKVAAAQAVATSKEDHYLIAQAQLSVAVKAKNTDAMASAIDTMATTGFVDAAKLSEFYTTLGVDFYKAKQFDRAAAEFQRASTYLPGNLEPLALLAEAQFSQGHPADGAATLSKMLLMSSAAGHKAEEKLYRRAVFMAHQAKDPSAVRLSRDWLVAYPSANSWRNALAIYRNANSLDTGPTLDLLRLMRATGAMTNASDYSTYAGLALDFHNFGEAQSVIDQGIAAKLVDPASPAFREVVTNVKSKPAATEAALLAAAKAAPTGSTLIGIGNRMYGLGLYAKAADIFRQALAKGADKDLANLHLGMSLVRAGDKAGATAALEAVGGAQAEIARYWLLYVQTLA
jgi:tetratricopeptide (TPR) repeat protein